MVLSGSLLALSWFSFGFLWFSCFLRFLPGSLSRVSFDLVNQRKHSRSALISLEEEEKKKHSLDADKEYLQSEECTKAVSAVFSSTRAAALSSVIHTLSSQPQLGATGLGLRSGMHICCATGSRRRATLGAITPRVRPAREPLSWYTNLRNSSAVLNSLRFAPQTQLLATGPDTAAEAHDGQTCGSLSHHHHHHHHQRSPLGSRVHSRSWRWHPRKP